MAYGNEPTIVLIDETGHYVQAGPRRLPGVAELAGSGLRVGPAAAQTQPLGPFGENATTGLSFCHRKHAGFTCARD